jgi:hypothetical protein
LPLRLAATAMSPLRRQTEIVLAAEISWAGGRAAGEGW